MTTESVRQPRSAGLAMMIMGVAVFAYTAFMFAFMILPLGVETQAQVIERRKEQDVSEWGRPRDTSHDVSVAQYTDAVGAKHTLEKDEYLNDAVTVRYLSFDPENVFVVDSMTQFQGYGYGIAALCALALVGQGGVWLFGRQRAAGESGLKIIQNH
ncbi:MAG: hypothetical protein FJ030_16150 [Chloroflexi bacterium]|nr:hypothetical protein [Chloroflexota bacterium]